MITPADLRQQLVADLRNVELRQKYLATRTPESAQADIRMATERLLTVRLVRGLIGLAAVGALGGVIAEMIRASSARETSAALPLLVAIGSSISGSISFAALAALGHVVFPELVGEDKKPRSGHGVGALVGHIAEQFAETACGAIWGAVCGLLIGVLAWVPAVGLASLGALAAVIAGAVGGAMLALIFSIVIVSFGSKATSATALRWGFLGPLPVWVYALPLETAHGRYLGSIRTVRFVVQAARAHES
jgi:hypothetical protein